MNFGAADAARVLAGLVAAVIVATSAALAYVTVSRGRDRPSALGWLLSSVAVALSPCFVPIAAGPVRLFATFVAIATLVKLYDQWRRPAPGDPFPNLLSRLGYLANWFWLVQSRPPAEVPRKLDRLRLAWQLPLTLAWMALCVMVFAYDWSPWPFALEHLAKAVAIGIPVILGTNCVAFAFRLAGARSLDPMVAPWFARTPLDTWRRWNRPVQQFLHEHCFLRCGGMKRPVRALLWTFFVSGLIHEYVFGIVTGRVQGWQMAFFLLQGTAAAVTLRFRPRGWQIPVAIAATLVFNLATLALFAMSVNQVVPFYSERLP